MQYTVYQVQRYSHARATSYRSQKVLSCAQATQLKNLVARHSLASPVNVIVYSSIQYITHTLFFLVYSATQYYIGVVEELAV